MRLTRNWLWAVAVVLAVPAVVVWIPGDAPPEPPRPALRVPAGPAAFAAPDRSASELLAPWVPPPAPRTAPPPSATPAPTVDRASLKYVGAVLTDNRKRYFFKVNATGQMLSLVPGEESKGWLLRSVDDQRFQLHGPGGEYEVAR